MFDKLKRLAWLACVGLGLVWSGGCNPKAEAPAPESPPAAEPEAASVELPTERVKAEVGVGKQGRSLDNETGVGGMIAEPARQLFAFKEKAVFDIQIPQAMQLFEATEGRKPNSHEEFMSRIIQANNIRLPELPAGQQYQYDPATAQLMVERPAR